MPPLLAMKNQNSLILSPLLKGRLAETQQKRLNYFFNLFELKYLYDYANVPICFFSTNKNK